MVWIDILLLLILAVSALVGWIRGLVTEVLSILAWVAAGVCSLLFSPSLAVQLGAWVPQSSLAYAISVLVIFVVVLLVASLVKALVKNLIHKTLLKVPDRVFGLVFGTLRGTILLILLVMIGSLTPLSQNRTWQSSVVIPQILIVVNWLESHFPVEASAPIPLDPRLNL